jgi:hypothetical protein
MPASEPELPRAASAARSSRVCDPLGAAACDAWLVLSSPHLGFQ